MERHVKVTKKQENIIIVFRKYLILSRCLQFSSEIEKFRSNCHDY